MISRLRWRARCWLWDTILRIKFKTTFDVSKLPLPPEKREHIDPIPFEDYYRSIPMRSILTADHVPKDERFRLLLFAVKAQVRLQRLVSQMQKGLPPVSGDDDEDLQDAFGDRFRKLFPPPEFPVEYDRDGTTDLGYFAPRSPYSCLLERTDDGDVVWDTTDLAGYETHDGVESVALRVVFEHDAANRTLAARRIELPDGTVTPDDAGWPVAVRRAMCAVTTKLALVNHFTNIHLVCGNHFSVATRNELPAEHPMIRLVWPPVYGTQYSNDLVMDVQAGPLGDFVNSYSFTYDSQCRLFEDFNARYSITVMDPYLDWAARGMDALELDAPAQDNLCELFDLVHDHATRWVEHYWADDDAVRADGPLNDWLDHLATATPNGIDALTGGERTRRSVARVAGAYLYVGAVLHEALGTSMWSYVTWNSKNPIRVYSSGEEVPLDVFKRWVTFNFMLSVHRAQFLDDYSYFGADEAGQRLWRQFRRESEELQERYSKLEPACWRMMPEFLEIGMNSGR